MKNEWLKLLVKVLVFCVLLISIDFGYGKICRYMEERSTVHNPTSFTAEYTMWHVNEDVLIIGASEAQHSYVSKILADNLGMSVYNCGEDGQFFYYQNAMVNGILDRYCPKLIIWSVNPSFLSFNPLAKERIGALKPFADENAYCRDMLRIKSKYEPLKIKSSCYVYNSDILPFVVSSISNPVTDNNWGWVPSNSKASPPEIKEAKYVNETDETCLSIFDLTLSRLKKNNIDVVFVFTPSYETGVYDTLDSYHSLLNTTNKYGYPIIEDLYHHDTLMDSTLYRDNMHLNKEGAVLFTTMLTEKLNYK